MRTDDHEHRLRLVVATAPHPHHDEGATMPNRPLRFIRVVLVAVALFVLGGVPTSAVARSRPVPAEPKVAYASYWGGSGAEGCEPTRGADGSLYVTCGTDSPNLPRVGGIQSYQGQERRLRRQARSQRQAHRLRDLSRIAGTGRDRRRRRGRPRPPLHQRLRRQRLPDDARRLRHHLQRRSAMPSSPSSARTARACSTPRSSAARGRRRRRQRWRSTTTAAS